MGSIADEEEYGDASGTDERREGRDLGSKAIIFGTLALGSVVLNQNVNLRSNLIFLDA